MQEMARRNGFDRNRVAEAIQSCKPSGMPIHNRYRWCTSKNIPKRRAWRWGRGKYRWRWLFLAAITKDHIRGFHRDELDAPLGQIEHDTVDARTIEVRALGTLDEGRNDRFFFSPEGSILATSPESPGLSRGLPCEIPILDHEAVASSSKPRRWSHRTFFFSHQREWRETGEFRKEQGAVG